MRATIPFGDGAPDTPYAVQYAKLKSLAGVASGHRL